MHGLFATVAMLPAVKAMIDHAVDEDVAAFICQQRQHIEPVVQVSGLLLVLLYTCIPLLC